MVKLYYYKILMSKNNAIATLSNAPENESPLLTKKRNNSICGKKALQIAIYVIDNNYYR